VRGRTYSAFRPWVMGDSVTLLHHGPVPSPAPTDFDELIRATRDCTMISVRAVVHAADPAWGANGPTYLQMLTSQGGHRGCYGKTRRPEPVDWNQALHPHACGCQDCESRQRQSADPPAHSHGRHSHRPQGARSHS
jgi:hypothetical protein